MAEATKPKTDMVVIKEYFGMSAKEAIGQVKTLTPEDKAQLAGGIRDESMTY
jgi:hypothetical protein